MDDFFFFFLGSSQLEHFQELVTSALGHRILLDDDELDGV